MAEGKYEKEYQYALTHKEDAYCRSLIDLASLYRNFPEPTCLALIEAAVEAIRKKPDFA